MRRILVKSVGMRKRGEASWFKSTQIDPNTQEKNVYNDLNVARKDEGERTRGQASRTPLGRAAPPCQVWPRASGIFLHGLSILGHLGVLVRKRKEKHGGEEGRH
jgi:hypothetical protein